MSLKGNASAKVLKGRIKLVDTLILSAYGVAVQNGFKGTEEEWLESLKGEPGYTPQKGIDYFDGEKGEKGAPGEKGESGNSGVYVGSGEMPEDCNVQIDPNGDTFELDEHIDERIQAALGAIPDASEVAY